MKTKTINIYSFNELSNEAKDHAIQQYRESNTEIFWADETIESLKGLFKNCSCVSLKDWSLGESNSWIRVSFTNDEVEELSGKRAMAWVENHLLSNIRIPCNSFALNGTRKKLAQYGSYYHAGMIKPCPFTGYCADDDFLDDLIKEIKSGTDLKTAFEGLATVYQKIINNEIEYQNSEEYITERFEANEYEFDEEGNRI
jgi:hypothetical protein